MPKKINNKVRINVDVTPEVHQKFRIKLIKEKISMMKVLEKFIEDYVK